MAVADRLGIILFVMLHYDLFQNISHQRRYDVRIQSIVPQTATKHYYFLN